MWCYKHQNNANTRPLWRGIQIEKVSQTNTHSPRYNIPYPLVNKHNVYRKRERQEHWTTILSAYNFSNVTCITIFKMDILRNLWVSCISMFQIYIVEIFRTLVRRACFDKGVHTSRSSPRCEIFWWVFGASVHSPSASSMFQHTPPTPWCEMFWCLWWPPPSTQASAQMTLHQSHGSSSSPLSSH